MQKYQSKQWLKVLREKSSYIHTLLYIICMCVESTLYTYTYIILYVWGYKYENKDNPDNSGRGHLQPVQTSKKKMEVQKLERFC